VKRYLAVAVLTCVQLACAQSLKLSVFEKLKEKASDVTDLNLSKDLLGLGASFLGKGDGDAAKVKKLVEGMQGIVIKSLEFEKEGMYGNADIMALIAELGAPGWNLVISADENKNRKGREIARIWIKTGSNGEFGGMRIMSAEPRELSVIEIMGKVSLEDLQNLNIHIPNINLGNNGNKKNDE